MNTILLQQLLDNRELSDELFLRTAYKTILHREIDAVGKNYYLNKLMQGETRKSVLQSIVHSQEAKQKGVIAPPCLTKERIIQSTLPQKVDNFISENVPSSLQARYKSIKSFGYTNYVKLIKRRKFNAQINDLKKPINEVFMQQINSNLDVNILENFKPIQSKKENQIWFDLTTSFEWQQGIVGIVRAELQVAKELKICYPDLKFFMYYGTGFVEIGSDQLKWLLNAEDIADAYLKFFKRKNFENDVGDKGCIRLNIPKTQEFFHPFKSHDIIFSMGWMDSDKEKFFGYLKNQNHNIYLSYLVYDTILVNEATKQYYHPIGSEKFNKYIEWISRNCDYIFFGGQTAQSDLLKIQQENNWPVKLSKALKFGSNSIKNISDKECNVVLNELSIDRNFVIAVGSIEPRKNYDTLYRAYLRALEKVCDSSELPILVICGSEIGGSEDLFDSIIRNPLLSNNVIKISPNEMQLAALYKKCLFTLLPSVYEGWSLTLPESLGQGKFCLCSDTPPLREIGEGLVDFVEKFNVEQWAEKIVFYSKNVQEIQKKENIIKELWDDISWLDTAESILEGLISFPLILHKTSAKRDQELLVERDSCVWMDLTLSFLNWNGGLSGIVRTELAYARYLYELDNSTRFFAYQVGVGDSYFFEIKHDYLAWLFNDLELSQAYQNFREFWSNAESNASVFRNPLLNVDPSQRRDVRLEYFPSGSCIFFAGIDNCYVDEYSAINALSKMKYRCDQTIVQLIYDFTPVLYPHLHLEATCNNYNKFLKAVYNNIDFIIYGGQTAQLDGDRVRESRGWRNPPSDFIEFGSDIKNEITHSADFSLEVLNKYGLKKGEYILTVGTIEPRKNHEMLYRAYEIKFFEGKLPEMPKLFIAGKAGWKTKNFLDTLERDSRFNGKIIVDSPTDQELDVLYENCAFTVLPTFYEGWSLTLPESLSYGKMSITSDVAPLKEVGKDMVPYINPLDVQEWSDKILYFFNNPDEVMEFEKKITSKWHRKTWLDSAKDLKSKIEKYCQERKHG